MSVFGQVWLYSLAAFALGVLLTWLLLVRPARARVRELERRIVAHRSEFVTGPEQPQHEDDRTAAQADADAAFAELDLVLPTAEGPGSDESAMYGTDSADWPDHFTDVMPTTTQSEWFTPTDASAEPEWDTAVDSQGTARGLFQPASPDTGPDHEPAVAEPAESTMVSDADVSAATTVTDETRTRSDSNLDEEPSAAGTLPKRQRGESAASEFDPPEPIQPSMRTVTRRDPASAARHSGSLFDPGETTTRDSQDAVPGQSGPFGHGSAMPLPGGEKPSDDFTIKASATTLRYCSPDSASFPEMVAEVWFRSPEDAEQVGFRPID